MRWRKHIQRKIPFSFLDSDRSKSKKKKKHSKSSRQRSLSPLSRRMALISGNMDPALVEAGLAGNNSAYNNPQMFASTSSAENMPNDYEMRVRVNTYWNRHIFDWIL